MRFVTERFLDELSADPDSVVTEVQTEENKPFLDIDVLSDLHVDSGTVNSAGGYGADEAARLRDAFLDRYHRLRSGFDVRGAAISGPHLVIVAGGLVTARKDNGEAERDRVESAYADVCLPAFRQLGDDLGERTGRTPRLLTVAGNDDAFAGGGPIDAPWAAADRPPGDSPYYRLFAVPLVAGPDPVAGSIAEELQPDKVQHHPVAEIFKIQAPPPGGRDVDGGVALQPLAYVVVIGFDSNDMTYHHDLVEDFGQIEDEQLRWSRQLITALQAGPGRHAPLYVMAVTHHSLLPVEDHVVYPPQGGQDERLLRLQQRLQEQVRGRPSGDVGDPPPNLSVVHQILADCTTGSTSNAVGFLDHCRQTRTSVVLQGSDTRRSSTTLTTVPLAAAEPVSELTVYAAPAFDPSRSSSGMARIRLDLWKAEARIVVQYEPDGDGESVRPVQITRPLHSASRVTPGERRLYTKVSELVHKALTDPDPRADIRPASVQEYARHVSQMWLDDGYAALSMPETGKLPTLGLPDRTNRYYLLLLLRETEGRNYELLLSRHNPVRPSNVAEWGTLLMPAFSSVRDLLQRMQLDVVRQIAVQAEDFARAESAQRFEAAIEQIEKGDGTLVDDIWQDQIRELNTANWLKISPTTGQLTDYEYHLVTLIPFVRSSDSPRPPGITEEEWKAQIEIVDWFNRLPGMKLPGAPAEGKRIVPLESVMSDGGGLRWDPAAEIEMADRGWTDDQHRGARLPPGSVWFPLPEVVGEQSPWRRVPSIRARNADVMVWVDKELDRRREADQSFPPQLVMGQLRTDEGYVLTEGPFPFAPDDRAPISTLQAMERVEYLDLYDLGKLAEQRPYAGLDCRPVALVRRALQVPSGRSRDVIAVFEADAGLGHDELEQQFRDRLLERGSGFLGLLRPAQRYVMLGGLDRAKSVNEFLDGNLTTPWGFLRATFGGAGDSVALTPPIIERVTPDDVDTEDADRLEFLVCDGNHRVVQKVWLGGEVAAAVAVVDEPVQPYYARPFSPFEWDMTADNKQNQTPQTAFRHAPRHIDDSELSEKAKKIMRKHPRDMWYRRYFRNLTKGFGDMGGQGGRW